MDPVPVSKRTWTTWNYVVRKIINRLIVILNSSLVQAYWVSDATNAPDMS
jgi:hypothetical protein